MNRRGITLTEVLVAIFVTGLGLMALMTLFPVGAVNMAQALADDRAQQAAANATAMLRAMWRHELDSPPALQDGTFAAVQNGPVYLDPIGCLTYAGGAVPVGGVIPRTMPAKMFGSPVTQRTIFSSFALMDDINFDPNGNALQTGTGLPREYLYTWAYMLRPPPQPAPPAGLPLRVLNYSVVIYNRRSAVANNSAVPGETHWPAPVTFVAGAYGNQKTILCPGTGPVTRGNWVLDASTSYFYRVDSVSQVSGNTVLKVDQPLRGAAASWQGPLVIMNSVSAVFEKSTVE